VTSVLGPRLTEKLRYDVDSASFPPPFPAAETVGYGNGSDTVAVSSGHRVNVELLRHDGAVGEILLPEEHRYLGTFGETVVSSDGAVHLWRLAGGAVEQTTVGGIVTGPGRVTAYKGDDRAVILRYQAVGEDAYRWGVVDLGRGTFTALDAGDETEFWLGADVIAARAGGSGNLDVYDRADPAASPRAVDISGFVAGTDFGIVGSTLLGLAPLQPGVQVRGQALRSIPLNTPAATPATVMNPAAHQIVPTPDGSVLVAGAAKYLDRGDLDWSIYRISAAPDGSLVRTRVTGVQPVTARIHGLGLGGGVLTVSDDSTEYVPRQSIGAFRSHWVTGGGTPSITKTTVDGRVTVGSQKTDCFFEQNPCNHLIANGAGSFSTFTNGPKAVLTTNGAPARTLTVPTGSAGTELASLSGRYGVLEWSAYEGPQYIADFRNGTVLRQRNRLAAAVWGSTLWSNVDVPSSAGLVQATRITDGTVIDGFHTFNGCRPSHLQAVGRWVWWACANQLGGSKNSGLYDRVTKRITVGVPVTGTTMLGDGYLIEQVRGKGLRLTDLRGGVTGAQIKHTDLPNRILVPEANYWGPHLSWTVDRFGGGVAYLNKDEQHVTVVPSGVPASAISVIDAEVSTKAANWSGTWWLSKPAASWQLAVKSTSGATLRTITGTNAHGLIQAGWDGRDAAGRAVADDAYTWTLTAQPADRQGAALTVTKPVPAPKALTATKAPAITGTVAVGSTVRAAAGSWSPAATSYAYQWAANGAAIKGATGSAYLIPATHLGKRLTVTVTAKRAGHPNGVAKSASSAKITKGKAPKATKKPKITGTAKSGKKVKVAVGIWSPKANSYRYEWRLNGKLIKGATSATLKLKSSMRGKKLTVTVIAKRTGHTDGRATSAAVKIR
jgi:hypothetical protein